MFKYITQKETYDCSPTAIVNALIWAFDGDVSKLIIQGYYTIAHLGCRTDIEGTTDCNFDKTLFLCGKHCFSTKRLKRFNLNRLESHFKAKGAIILAHKEIWEKQADWHHSIFIGKYLGFYVGINVKAGKKYFICREKYFKKLLNTGDGKEKPEVWLLTKKD